MKKIRFIKIVLFCAIIYGSALLTLLHQDQESSDIENRTLAQKPVLSTQEDFLSGSYQNQYEEYLEDQVIGRDKWVSLSTAIQRATGMREINGVYFGKKHYLLEKWQESDFDEEQVEENMETLSAFLNETAESYGQDHVSCIMVPSKTNSLSEYLPKYVDAMDQTSVLQELRDQLSYPDSLLDLSEALQQHGEEYIYYRTDHHWTTLGAYYGYHAWAEQSGQATAYPLEHYQRETVFQDFNGTTYNKVLRGGKPDQVELFHSAGDASVHVSLDAGAGNVESDSMYFPEEAAQGFDRYRIFFSQNTFQIEVDTQAKTGKTLLLVKDSFANCFVPFLTENYDKIIMIDYRYGKESMGSVLDRYKGITDILVLFNTEKFMQNSKLEKLADLRREETEENGMEEFRLEDFM